MIRIPTTSARSASSVRQLRTADERTRAIRARSLRKSFHAGVHGCSAVSRAVSGVSLDVFPGEYVGIAGGPGSGKTTLLLLLSGMLAPDAGTVEWLTESGLPLREPIAIEYLPARRDGNTVQSMRRALEGKPGVLLLDDPLLNLDHAARREVRGLLRELRAARITMVHATTPDADSLALCTRVLQLQPWFPSMRTIPIPGVMAVGEGSRG